jgi:hypothetical protein
LSSKAFAENWKSIGLCYICVARTAADTVNTTLLIYGTGQVWLSLNKDRGRVCIVLRSAWTVRLKRVCGYGKAGSLVERVKYVRRGRRSLTGSG